MWAAVAATALALAPGAPLGAQQFHQAEEAALVRNLDSILPLYAKASEANAREQARLDALKAQQERAAAPRGPLFDTISVGPLRIVTPPDQARTAREMFSSVWREYQPEVEDSPAFKHTLFTFQWSYTLSLIPVKGDVQRADERRWESRATVEDRIRQAIGMALSSDLSSTRIGRRWRPGPVRGVDGAAVYRELATTPAKPNRACLAGDAHACAEALGLEVSADSWKSWLTPQEQRDIALSMDYGGEWGDRRMQALQNACRAGRQSACSRVVADLYTRRIRPLRRPGTLNNDARGSLLWLALQHGGRGAWERLLADTVASPEQALTDASGLGVDQLCAAWRRWVVEQRPDVAAGFGSGMLTAGFWILLFAALAMRSTRWRLG